MPIRLGDIAPDFTAQTSVGEINFHEWLGDSWGLLFSHPADFTPVCTTELGRTAGLKPQLDMRDVKAIALSVDLIDDHHRWIRDIEETQACTVNFPIIADHDRAVATLYDMIHPNMDSKATVRSVFVIAPDKTVQLTLTYPPSTGRNFLEILRVIDSLQLTKYHSVATPADWTNGQEVIISPGVDDAEARRRFPGFRTVKPYLRYTEQPDEYIPSGKETEG